MSCGSWHFTSRYMTISANFVFFLNFFTCCIFDRFFHIEMLDISVSYRYISDILPILSDFFPIFPSNYFRLQKSFREDPTHDISRYFHPWLPLSTYFKSILKKHFLFTKKKKGKKNCLLTSKTHLPYSNRHFIIFSRIFFSLVAYLS